MTPSPSAGDVAKLELALAGPLGWIFMNPDTGIEWSEHHPIESGEVPDASDVRPGYAVHLHHHLIAAWEDARAYAEVAKVQRLRAEDAEFAMSRLEKENAHLSRDLADAREELRILSDDYRTLGDRAAATSRDLAEARATLQPFAIQAGEIERVADARAISVFEVRRAVDYSHCVRARSVLPQKEADR